MDGKQVFRIVCCPTLQDPQLGLGGDWDRGAETPVFGADDDVFCMSAPFVHEAGLSTDTLRCLSMGVYFHCVSCGWFGYILNREWRLVRLAHSEGHLFTDSETVWETTLHSNMFVANPTGQTEPGHE